MTSVNISIFQRLGKLHDMSNKLLFRIPNIEDLIPTSRKGALHHQRLKILALEIPGGGMCVRLPLSAFPRSKGIKSCSDSLEVVRTTQYSKIWLFFDIPRGFERGVNFPLNRYQYTEAVTESLEDIPSNNANRLIVHTIMIIQIDPKRLYRSKDGIFLPKRIMRKLKRQNRTSHHEECMD